MATADNFMWDPDGVIQGETTDSVFHKLPASGGKTARAFEISKWGFSVNNGEEGESESEEKGAEKKDAKDPATKRGSIKRRLGAMPGKLQFQSVKIDKVIDAASNLLYKFCCTEDPIPTLMLATRRASGDAFIYLQYMFRECYITSVQWDGSSGAERAQESFTFKYKALELYYVQQKPNGDPFPAKWWSWNVVSLDANGKGTSTMDIVDGFPVPDFAQNPLSTKKP